MIRHRPFYFVPSHLIHGLSMTLDRLTRTILRTIVRAPEAWSVWDDLEARWPGVLERLESEGLVERWPRPDYLAVTLSPLAASRLGVQIVEHWHYETRDVGREQQPPSHHNARIAEEIPGWRPIEDDPGPIHLPHYAQEVPLRFPDRLPDHRAPAYLTDELSGEPVVLWGQRAALDRRIRGKR